VGTSLFTGSLLELNVIILPDTFKSIYSVHWLYKIFLGIELTPNFSNVPYYSKWLAYNIKIRLPHLPVYGSYIQEKKTKTQRDYFMEE